jgi:hypothetical protein
MRCRNLFATSAAALALTIGHAAAAPIVHDTLGELRLQFAQGRDSDGKAVAANRSNTANLFDTGNGSATSILSLGLGGTLGIELLPAHRRIVSGEITERTDGRGRSGHVERAELFLGNDLAGWVKVATLLNRPAGAGAPGVTVHAADLIRFAAPAQQPDISTYSFTLLGNRGFDSLRLVDASDTKGRNFDGFDIGRLSLSSVAVPVPAALALFGVGLLGLTAATGRGRRRG